MTKLSIFVFYPIDDDAIKLKIVQSAVSLNDDQTPVRTGVALLLPTYSELPVVLGSYPRT
jgi:hypothetical protein